MPDTPEILAAIGELSKRVDKLSIEAHALSEEYARQRDANEARDTRQRWKSGIAIALCGAFCFLGAASFGAARTEHRQAGKEYQRVAVEMCHIENRAQRDAHGRVVGLLEAIKAQVPDQTVANVVDEILTALPEPGGRDCAQPSERSTR